MVSSWYVIRTFIFNNPTSPSFVSVTSSSRLHPIWLSSNQPPSLHFMEEVVHVCAPGSFRAHAVNVKGQWSAGRHYSEPCLELCSLPLFHVHHLGTFSLKSTKIAPAADVLWLFLHVSENDVFSFGCGSYGQLGGGDTAHRLVPTKVAALSGKNFAGVSCGGATLVWTSGMCPPACMAPNAQYAMLCVFVRSSCIVDHHVSSCFHEEYYFCRRVPCNHTDHKYTHMSGVVVIMHYAILFAMRMVHHSLMSF